MARSNEVVEQIVARKPFTVLGYSADDAVWCPACLRTAAGLSPGRPDTSGKPIFPLFARDATVREEVCENCERSLHDLLADRRNVPEPKPVAAELRVHGKRAALEFERVPPVGIRTALKSTGWRWDARLRVWWSGEEVPPVPAGVVLACRESAPVPAKAPVVRRRR
jgi:hypothetical protein